MVLFWHWECATAFCRGVGSLAFRERDLFFCPCLWFRRTQRLIQRWVATDSVIPQVVSRRLLPTTLDWPLSVRGQFWTGELACCNAVAEPVNTCKDSCLFVYTSANLIQLASGLSRGHRLLWFYGGDLMLTWENTIV